jgi:hypothetical protein
LGVECIRPTLSDKNVFSAREPKLIVPDIKSTADGCRLGLDLLHQPNPSGVTSKSKKAFVAAIIRDFFDMSGHSFIKRHPEVLDLLDELYNTIVVYGFDDEVSTSRKLALKGSCAFNIFVKSNTVINNRHLKFVDRLMEDRLREVVEINLLTNPDALQNESEDEVQQKLLSALEVKKAENVRHLEILRAITSEYVFLVLEEFLREVNIRDCKGNQMPAKKASLLAALGLTLEQVLDFAESTTRSKSLDSEMEKMLRHLGLVLLSYLEPPSSIAFPESVEINECFGKDPNDVTGVFMKDTFWYELWKASSNAIPAQLLQVATQEAPKPESPNPEPNPLLPQLIEPPREGYRRQVEAMSRPYMRMNLSFRNSGANSTYQTSPYQTGPYQTGP